MKIRWNEQLTAQYFSLRFLVVTDLTKRCVLSRAQENVLVHTKNRTPSVPFHKYPAQEMDLTTM